MTTYFDHSRFEFADAYVTLARDVMTIGRARSPRGVTTFDVPDLIVDLDPRSECLPIDVGRLPSRALGAVEAFQLCLALELPELMLEVSTGFKPFVEDDDGRFHGAYGARIGDQLSQCYRKLSDDPYTRQAVISLWNPQRDNIPLKRDYPCTLALTFSIRDDRLDLSVTMRSNDVWLGMAYDVFQFTELQWTLAQALGAAVGAYTHHAVSMHLYERDMEKVHQLHLLEPDEHGQLPERQTYGFGRPGVDPTPQYLAAAAQRVLWDTPETGTEEMYADLLRDAAHRAYGRAR